VASSVTIATKTEESETWEALETIGKSDTAKITNDSKWIDLVIASILIRCEVNQFAGICQLYFKVKEQISESKYQKYYHET
jgi:hypothetical protein